MADPVDPEDPTGEKFDKLAKEIEAMGKHPWRDRPGEKDEAHVLVRPPTKSLVARDRTAGRSSSPPKPATDFFHSAANAGT